MIMNKNKPVAERKPAELTPFLTWLRRLEKSESTGERWVAKGWLLEPVNIGGIRYLTPENIDQFFRRARNGEFATVRNPDGLKAYREQKQREVQTTP